MEITAQDVRSAVDDEIKNISQQELAIRIRQLLVPVRCEQREWDYGSAGQTYPCWIVAEHTESNTAFAYCAQGFGPSSPWGLLAINGEHMSIGMDCGWFISLEEAFRDSMAWDGSDPAGYEVH